MSPLVDCLSKDWKSVELDFIEFKAGFFGGGSTSIVADSVVLHFQSKITTMDKRQVYQPGSEKKQRSHREPYYSM